MDGLRDGQMLEGLTAALRELSDLSEPADAARLIDHRIIRVLYPRQGGLALSRRGLERPAVRITRSDAWGDTDPWAAGARERLPVVAGGLLGELIWAGELAVLRDLPRRLAADDPGRAYLAGYDWLVAVPNFHGGEATNMGVLLGRGSAAPSADRMAEMLVVQNLLGRSTQTGLLARQLRSAYAEIDAELKVVGDIQRSLLPAELPRVPGLEIAAHYQTSRRAGGDYYDLFEPECSSVSGRGGPWGMLIADVSGHGTPSAVLMAVVHALMHQCPHFFDEAGAVLGYLNRELCARYTTGGTFVTALMAAFDPDSRRLTWASAGHNPPRVRSGGGVAELRRAGAGLPLGIDAGEVYGTDSVVLERGDELVLYTDGVTETFSPGGDMFGVERLDEVLMGGCDERPARTIERVMAAVDAFGGGAAAADDRTLVVLRVT